MIDALLLVAVLGGIAGAWQGNRPAIALLASTALTSVFVWIGVPFNLALWLAIDGLVIAAIASCPVTWQSSLIVALFVPAWALYGTPIAHDAITLIVSAQLLLTFPAAAVWARIKRVRLPDKWDDPFDLRAVHVEPGG